MNKIVEELTQYFLMEVKKEENINKMKVFVIEPLIEYTLSDFTHYFNYISYFFLTFISYAFLILNNN